MGKDDAVSAIELSCGDEVSGDVEGLVLKVAQF
jgi:hypothetical protein